MDITKEVHMGQPLQCRAWSHELPPTNKQSALEPMDLEVREKLLNERLIERYYARRAEEVKQFAVFLQR